MQRPIVMSFVLNMMQVATTMLRTAGISFDVAQNGKEAVDLITNAGDDPPAWHDIVLMDLQMPVMDGLQVCAVNGTLVEVVRNYKEGRQNWALAMLTSAFCIVARRQQRQSGNTSRG